MSIKWLEILTSYILLRHSLFEIVFLENGVFYEIRVDQVVKDRIANNLKLFIASWKPIHISERLMSECLQKESLIHKVVVDYLLYRKQVLY